MCFAQPRQEGQEIRVTYSTAVWRGLELRAYSKKACVILSRLPSDIAYLIQCKRKLSSNHLYLFLSNPPFKFWALWLGIRQGWIVSSVLLSAWKIQTSMYILYMYSRDWRSIEIFDIIVLISIAISLDQGCANHDTEGKPFKSPVHCCDVTKPPYLFNGELRTSPLHVNSCLCTQRVVGAPGSASLCSEHGNQTS